MSDFQPRFLFPDLGSSPSWGDCSSILGTVFPGIGEQQVTPVPAAWGACSRVYGCGLFPPSFPQKEGTVRSTGTAEAPRAAVECHVLGALHAPIDRLTALAERIEAAHPCAAPPTRDRNPDEPQPEMSLAMPAPPTPLRIAARPFTSPCAVCDGEIPEELNTAVFALADDQAATVCDHCANSADPAAYGALHDLRNLDAAYWAIYNRDGWPGTHDAREAAATYLRTLVDGAAALMAMYLSPEQARDACQRLREVVDAGLASPSIPSDPTPKAA